MLRRGCGCSGLGSGARHRGCLVERRRLFVVRLGLTGDPVLELAHAMAESLAEGGKLLGTDEQKDDDEDDQCVRLWVAKHD